MLQGWDFTWAMGALSALAGAPATAVRPEESAPSAQTVDPSFDPRDYEWAPPSDEDRVWETGAPAIPVGIRLNPGKHTAVPPEVRAKLRPLQQPLEEKRKSGTCGICFCEGEAVTFACGQHYFCTPCTQAHFRVQLAASKVPKCPQCGAEAHARVAEQLLSSKEFDMYLLAYLRATHRVQDCPQCSAAVYLEEGAPPSTRCPECSSRFCSVCACPWSSSHSCEASMDKVRRRRRRQASRAFQELAIALGFKSCPSCNAACEKSDPDSCHHMTCPSCAKEFCWLCLADRAVILHHGNHYHMPDCRFYAAYSGPAELEARCPRCQQRGRPCTPPDYD